MLSDEDAHTVSAGIAAPGAEENQPYQKGSALKTPGEINIGKHHGDIDHAEEGRHDLVRMVFRICKYIDGHQYDQNKNHIHHTICLKSEK